VRGCTNNILIADAIMLAEALRAVPETLRRAGRYYAVVPAHVDGCFHPKVFLRLGRDRGCLQIASANATAAGWCRNLELSAKLSWTNDGNDPEAAAKRSLIRKAYDYLLHWLEASPGQAIPAKLQIHANDADWLLDTEPNSGPVLLHDATAVDLLLERGDGSSPGILDRLRACVDRDRINRIVIVSPYWDANGEALLDLQDAFGGAPVIVGLNPGSGTFPGALDVSQRPITFATDKTLRVERFAHAKLFLLEGEKADHVVFGSPNASRAALGAPGIPARNAEAAVYRRLPPSSVRHALKLTLDDTVKRSAIPPAPVSSFREGAHRVASGLVEIEGREITWWPAPNCSATGASLVLGPARVSVRPSGNGQGLVELAGKPPLPLVVHFVLADGRETLPVIVHDYDELRAAAPGSYGPMGKIFGEYESGTCDLLDLAAVADFLFPLPGSVKPPSGGGERKNEADEHETEFDDEDDFRQAVELPRSPGRFVATSADDPVSHFLRRIGLGCLLGYLDPVAERQRQESADENDKLGEEGDESPENDNGDGNRGGSDDEHENGHRDEPKRRTPPQDGVFTGRQVARRRNSLANALNRFDEWLNKLARDPSIPTDDVPAKVAFMLSVMNEAARLRHKMEGGSTETLMTVVPVGSDRDFSVAVRAAKVLSTIWRGFGHTPPLAQRLKPDSPRARIRMEVAAFAEKSRWMMARCLLALEEVGSHPGLEPVIEKAAIRVVVASYRLGVRDRA
jgi:hypothetical protein